MKDAWRNPRIRRLLASYLGFVAAEWGTWLTVLIYAYDRDGAVAVGFVATAQLIPAALVAPFAPHLIDRVGRSAPLVVAYGLQAATVTATAVAVLVAPSWVVYLCATAMTTSISFARPAHATTLIGVAESPKELTAANGAGGAVDGAGIIAGPVAVSLLYGLLGPGGFLFVVAAVLCAALAVAAPIRFERAEWRGGDASGRSAVVDAVRVAHRGGPSVAVMALVAAWIGMGLLDVLIVVLALGELGGGSELVGVLNAALGIGGLLAGIAAARMVGRMAVLSIGAGLMIAAVGLGAISLLPFPVAIAVLMAAVGMGHGLAEVGSRGVLMRLVPARSIGNVFGLIEGVYAASLAIGAAVAPLVLTTFPVSVALAGIAVAFALMSMTLFPVLSRVASAIRVPAGELDVLRRVPIFRPLPVSTLEWLARGAERLALPAGTVVIRQGDVGDRFFAVEDGELDATVGGRSIRRLAIGDYFGEIALLRDSLRTATVTAVTDIALVAVRRAEFLEAVTDHATAGRVAAEAVATRLAHEPGSSASGS